MKMIERCLRYLIICITLGLVAGCASPAIKDATGNIFQQPIKQVHQASVDALVVTGFDIKKQEPKYIEGFRPHKIGLIVGSGGETVGVWLEELGPNKTSVNVDTAKSALGILGQKNWNTEIMSEITRSLIK
jgi:hypothetical protein